ncbi:MAG: hypothetical protein EOO40_02115 [Deltaproteobacteria bacterium]|nr:MAG: hypothetical protein EOO40_02115 [Deltaproteobacteria bacterium]
MPNTISFYLVSHASHCPPTQGRAHKPLLAADSWSHEKPFARQQALRGPAYVDAPASRLVCAALPLSEQQVDAELQAFAQDNNACGLVQFIRGLISTDHPAALPALQWAYDRTADALVQAAERVGAQTGMGQIVKVTTYPFIFARRDINKLSLAYPHVSVLDELGRLFALVNQQPARPLDLDAMRTYLNAAAALIVHDRGFATHLGAWGSAIGAMLPGLMRGRAHLAALLGAQRVAAALALPAALTAVAFLHNRLTYPSTSVPQRGVAASPAQTWLQDHRTLRTAATALARAVLYGAPTMATYAQGCGPGWLSQGAYWGQMVGALLGTYIALR